MSNVETWRTWEGRVVDGKFPLRQWLGGSDHSAVFLTERQGHPTEKAAMKIIALDPGEADRQLARWRAAAQFSHSHLIRIFEAGRCQLDGTPIVYLVMEYAEEDLSQILPERALSPAEAADLLPPMLDALSYLHLRGFVHGRIKPSNVQAVGDQLKLSTDQVQSSNEPNSSHKRRDVFDAPETSAGIVSSAGDVWSLGATLVAVLTQKADFPGGTAQGDPAIPDTIPEPFHGIARECLRIDPKRRCSIAEIQARLKPEARSVPVKLEPPPAARSTVSGKPILALLLAVAAIVGSILLYSRAHSHRKNPTESAETPQPTAPAIPASPKGETAAPAKKAVAPRGEVVHQVLPEISASARNTISGTIKIGVRVAVDSSGKVTSARLVSPGPSKYFARLVLQAAEQWEFSPPQVDGQPTASTWLLRFRLKRTSTQASPERLSR